MMNDWIKTQKKTMFVPVVNYYNFYENFSYYKEECNNPKLAEKVIYSSLLGMIPVGFLAGTLIWTVDAGMIVTWIGRILMYYGVPLSMNYFMLRTQCKHLKVTPDDIGANFYKFLLLKKITPPKSQNDDTYSNDTNKSYDR